MSNSPDNLPISNLAAHIIRILIDARPVNGYIAKIPPSWAEIAQAIEAAPPSRDQRARAFESAIAGRADRAAIMETVMAANAQANLAELAIKEDQQEIIPFEDLPDETPPLLTDLGNARRFAKQYGSKMRYTLARGWLIWTNKRWEEDKTGKVMRFAKAAVKEIYREAERAMDRAKAMIRAVETAQEQGNETAIREAKEAKERAEKSANALLNWAIKSQGRARIEAMIALAESEPEIAARAEDFDRDPWLLNVQNGILDLRTGILNEHDPKALMSKIAGAPYHPGAPCPTWLSFLDRIFSGNQELIGFLQRAAGYSLTGDVGEQCLFFLYGTGANGKSTFTGALQDVMGNYAMKTRAETLMVKKQDAIPEEVAQLAGVRLMLAAELGEGQKLNESLVKDLTGGDKLRARILYHDSFEFYPTAKPWLYGNHKPAIRGTDNGIWRRPKLIPFEVVIPENDKDRKLPDKLHTELPGILSWAVNGCLEWQRQDGLQTPDSVMMATAQYRAEQDVLAAFINDCCIVNNLATVTAIDLYQAYKVWAEESGITPSNKLEFSRRLSERGFMAKSRQPGTGRALYSGLGLLNTHNQEKNL